MSTGRAEAIGAIRRVGPHLLAALLVALLSASCGPGTAPAPPGPQATVPYAVQESLTEALDERGAALATGDEDRFLDTIHRSDATFRNQQRTYFANVQQLPVVEIGFALDAGTLVAAGGDYWSEVRVTLQLDGYDNQPVVSRYRFRFSPSTEVGRYVVSSTTDADWELRHGVQAQPWDVGEIRVVRDSGVLGIFDETTIAVAGNVLDAVGLARYDVSWVVPDSELVDVIVYATSDLSFLTHLRGLPVLDPERLDAVTIPVLADAERSGTEVASYRILVNPRVLEEELRLLDRLMRHELTHVALGDRAAGAPLWLNEGIAEWVSVQPIAPARRVVPPGALDVARDGWDSLPGASEFAGDDAAIWYAVSWWICEYLALTYDPSLLWYLLDRVVAGDDQDEVIRELTGLRTSQLVRRAMRMMVGHYEEDEAEPTEEPTEDATEDTTDEPTEDVTPSPEDDSTPAPAAAGPRQ
jgi:hypothetical protein